MFVSYALACVLALTTVTDRLAPYRGQPARGLHPIIRGH